MGKSIRRCENWKSELDEFIRQNFNRKFKWGSWDCCLFVVGAVKSMSGVNIGEWFEGKYHDKRTAFVAIREFCDGDLIDMVDKTADTYGFKSINNLLASFGDIVVCDDGYKDIMGVCVGHSVLVLTENGIITFKKSLIVKTWRI